jgi:tetratricopeptide (TPR) repeat protein
MTTPGLTWIQSYDLSAELNYSDSIDSSTSGGAVIMTNDTNIDLPNVDVKYGSKHLTPTKEVLQEAKEAASRYPNSAIARGHLGEVLYLMKQYQEAIAELTIAAETFEKSLEEHSGNLKIVDDSGPQHTKHEYESLTNTYLTILGDCYVKIGEVEKAKTWVEKALDASDILVGSNVDPSLNSRYNTWALYGLTMVLSDDFASSLKPIRRALMYDISNQSLWGLLYELYLITNRKLANYVAQGKTAESYYFQAEILTNVCFAAADYDNAPTSLFNPDSWQSIEYYGHSQLFRQDYDSVIRYIEPFFQGTKKAIGKHRDDWIISIGLLLTRAYLLTGRWADAEKSLVKIAQYAFQGLDKIPEHEKLTLILSRQPLPAQRIIDSVERFFHILFNARDPPTQRFSLLTCNFEDDSFAYYPEIIVPSGITLHDFLHWSQHNFDEMFPSNLKITRFVLVSETVTPDTDSRPEELKDLELDKVTFKSIRSMPDDEDTIRTMVKLPDVTYESPIINGDVISIFPDNADERLHIRSAGALGILSSEADKFLDLRERVLSETLPRTFSFVKGPPEDVSASYESHLTLAQIYLTTDRISGARHHLHEAKEIPSNKPISSSLLRALVTKEQYKEAFPFIERIASMTLPDSYTKDVSLWYNMGSVYDQMGREYYDKAEDAFKKAVKIDKHDLEAKIYLGAFYVDRARTKEGLKLINEVLKKDKENLVGLLVKIYALCMAEDFKKAEKIAREVLEKTPFSGTWAALSKVLIGTQNWDDALEAAKKAISDNRKDPNGWSHAGEAYLGKGDIEEAEKALRKAVEINSADGESWYLLHVIFKQKGMNDEASEAMRNAWNHGASKAKEV